MAKETPSGIRLNNPGNLRYDSTAWQGLADPPQSATGFCIFKDATWGIRAMARVLIAYQDKHDIRTIRGIINRWAPPADQNDVGAYILDVAQRTGIGADSQIDLQSYDDLKPVIQALIWHENGQQPYTDAQIDKGLTLAGVAKPGEGLKGSRTFSGLRVAAAGIAGLQAVDLHSVQNQLNQLQTQLQGLMDVAECFKHAFVVVAALGLVVAGWARYDDYRRGVNP